MIDLLRRDVGPRPSLDARGRWRRVGAVALVAAQVLGFGALIWLVWYRIGLPAAVAYALVLAAMLRLTWDRVPGWLEIATYALLIPAFIVFLALIPRFADESDPAYRLAVARASMTWRTYGGLLWIVQIPPAKVRRLWRGEPFSRRR